MNSEGDSIVVGERVEVSDCPAHWNWASPFKVEETSGEMVKLEMVGDWVEMSRLEKCQKTNG
jgi:putative DNA primase/helicase